MCVVVQPASSPRLTSTKRTHASPRRGGTVLQRPPIRIAEMTPSADPGCNIFFPREPSLLLNPFRATAMLCRCTVDTLRLFIRSIAQVDLSASKTFGPSSPLLIRSCNPAASTRDRYLPRRAYATTPFSDSKGSINGLTDVKSASGSPRWLEGHLQSKPDADSAVVELSPEAVDAIAADLAPQEPSQHHETPSREYETPLKSLLKDLPMKQPKPPVDPVSRITGRRTKVANNSFALHFSKPRRTDSNSKTGGSASRPTSRDEWTPPEREHWQIDKEALSKKFPDGWNPRKRLSPDAITGIRALHAQMPERYDTQTLSQEFGVTAEAIRRILKSKWSPSPEEETDRQRRWLKRGQQVWSRYAELGVKPPKLWRELGIGQGKPDWMKRKQEWTKKQQQPRDPPVLITTARRREANGNSAASLAAKSSSLADRIL